MKYARADLIISVFIVAGCVMDAASTEEGRVKLWLFEPLPLKNFRSEKYQYLVGFAWGINGGKVR